MTPADCACREHRHSSCIAGQRDARRTPAGEPQTCSQGGVPRRAPLARSRCQCSPAAAAAGGGSPLRPPHPQRLRQDGAAGQAGAVCGGRGVCAAHARQPWRPAHTKQGCGLGRQHARLEAGDGRRQQGADLMPLLAAGGTCNGAGRGRRGAGTTAAQCRWRELCTSTYSTTPLCPKRSSPATCLPFPMRNDSPAAAWPARPARPTICRY